MIEYSYVLPNSEVLKSVERVYNESFPSIERRQFENVKILLEKETVPFKMIVATEDGVLQGFLSYWEFDRFRYIEHFAVDESLRGKGIGSGLLEHFIKECDKTPVILEVEIPESNDVARRRVDFYMRHSYILWRLVKYMQPPYDGGNDSLEMRLMTLQVNDKVKVEQMGEVVKREVYKKIEEY